MALLEQHIQDDCQTADDVWRAAAAVRERRRIWETPIKKIVIQPEIKPKPVPKITFSFADLCPLMGAVYGHFMFDFNTELPIFSIRQIQSICCKTAGINKSELISNRRSHPTVHIRQVAMALCKLFTAKSLPEIGRRFQKDHTTVLHAVQKYEWIIERLRQELKKTDPMPAWIALAYTILKNEGGLYG